LDVQNNDLQIITDGLLVRGIYSTVTLAVYGFPVDKVHIKELEAEKKEPIQPKAVVVSESVVAKSSPPPPASPVVEFVQEEDTKIIIPLEAIESPPPPPQTIQIITTTRLNYDASQEELEENDNKEFAQQEEPAITEGEQHAGNNNVLPSPILIEVVPIPEIMDTEDISDGEVFPSDDEDIAEIIIGETEEHDVKSIDKVQSVEDTKTIIDPLIEEVEPISSPPQDLLSDVDDSLVDEFQEPGFEEIISDEEIDFPEYDYGEWEENLAHKFSRTFNPFSESFQVFPTKVI
jgi:hypothetical protein